MADDLTIIKQIINGEMHLYNNIVKRYQSVSFALAYKILNDRHEAEEATQDAFVKAYIALKKFKGDSKFSTWLYRIVFNTAVSYKRKVKIETIPMDAYTEVNMTGDTGEEEEKKRLIWHGINKLPQEDRSAIQLYYMNELNMEEAAEVLQITVSAMKVRVHRARQRLADVLTQTINQKILTH